MTQNEIDQITRHLTFHLDQQRRIISGEIQHQFRMHELECHSGRRLGKMGGRRVGLRPLLIIGALSVSVFANHVQAEAIDYAPCEDDDGNPLCAACVERYRAEQLGLNYFTHEPEAN